VAPADISRRTAGFWLAAIVALGAALRLWHIGREALWADEALTAVIARYPPYVLLTEPVDPTGPLYYLIFAALVPAGSTETIARLPSLVAGFATILATYGLGRTLSSRLVGVVAAAIVAVSSPLIEYSQEARSYALLVALTTCSAWALASLFEPHSRKARRLIAAAFVLTTIAAVYTHLVGALWAVSSLAALVAAVRHGDLSRREAGLIIVAVAILITPELRRLALYATGPNNFTWLEPASILDLGRILAWQWVPFAHRSVLLASAIALMVLAIAIWAGRRHALEWVSARRMQGVPLALLVGQPVLVWIVGAAITPILMYRTAIQAVPGFAVILALIVSWQSPRWRAWIAAAVVATYALSAFDHGLVQPKAPWRTVAGKADGERTALVCPAWQIPAFLAQSGATTVLAWRNGALLMVKSPADPPGTTWEQAYLERVRLGRGDLLPPIPARSLVVVLADCSPTDRAATARHMSALSFRRIRADVVKPPRQPKINLENGEPDITVEVWTAAQPTRLDNAD
jgi:uncharacterized membrane protein